jgi:hypothetical protein
MSEIITPTETLYKGVTDLVENSECSLFEAVGVLDLVKTELKFVFLAANEDEADDFASEEVVGEFESDGVVGE